MSAIADLAVLIVDDHEAMRALLRKVLERAGARDVRDAPNGVAGLAALQERPAALILADHMMPEMDGVLFVAEARKRTPEARIIMITGRPDAVTADKATAAGADAVLVKPVAPSALMQAVGRVFGA